MPTTGEIQAEKRFAAVIVAFMLILSASRSSGVTLVNDDFSDSDRFKTGTSDASWLHYNMVGGSGPTGGYLSVVPDATAMIGSGNALQLGPVDRPGVAQYSNVVLANDGDYIKLSFAIRVDSGFPYFGGFRYSLFDNGSELQTDEGNESDGGVGYGGWFGTHVADAQSYTVGPGGSNAFSKSFVGSIPVTALDIAQGGVHQVELKLTKTGADLGVVVNVDSVEIGNGVTTPHGFTFNAVGFYNGDAWASPPATMFIDNVIVDTTGTIVVQVPGDFDSDSDVDGADFVAWQTHFPTTSGATLIDGDADGDGDVDGADFVVWQTHFPTTPGAGVNSVPEMNSALMLIAGAAATLLARRRTSVK